MARRRIDREAVIREIRGNELPYAEIARRNGCSRQFVYMVAREMQMPRRRKAVRPLKKVSTGNPIATQLLRAAGRQKQSMLKLATESNVRYSTVHRWYEGKARTGELAEACRVAETLGYELRLVPKEMA